MRFSRSSLVSGRQRTGKPSVRTLISHSLAFVAGVSICRLSDDLSDSVAFINSKVGGVWNVTVVGEDPLPLADVPQRENKYNTTHVHHAGAADKNAGQTAIVPHPGVIKKTGGHGADNTIAWKLVDWESPISEEEEAKFNCDMTPFIATRSNPASRTQICVHTFNDIITNVIKREKRWGDCNVLPRLWERSKERTGQNDNGDAYYLEVGANIGSCVMEMLLSTNAKIIAFEPHPMNVYNLKKSVSQLDKSYQDRLMLFPIGLGESAGQSTIYSANNNMGNSVVGKIIKDDDIPGQKFTEELQFTIFIERLDSILNNAANLNIRLMKMDAQGFECNVLKGMGADLAKKVRIVKTEYATRFLDPLNCMDLVKRIKDYGFDVYRDYRNGKFHYRLGDAPPGKQHIDLYALNKNSSGLQS